jgi:hypothetical protein
MGIVATLFETLRGPDDRDTLTGCQTALSRLAAERKAAIASTEAAMARRRTLLVEDGTDKQIAAIDREIDANQLTLERLELIEDDFLARLQGLQSDYRKADWMKCYKRHAVAAADYIDKHRAARRAFDALTAITDEVRAAGYEHEAMAHFIAPPQMLAMELIANFEREVERVGDSVAGRTIPTRPQPVRKPYIAPSIASPTGGSRGVVSSDTAPRRSPVVETAKDGEVLVRVIRSGIEAPSGLQCIAGDQIAMMPAIAEQAVRNGAAEFAN